MAYWDQSLLSTDQDFMARIASCAAVEVPLNGAQPMAWASDNQWTIAAAPGFADKYAYAIATAVPNPGREPSVISDADILSAVQALVAAP